MAEGPHRKYCKAKAMAKLRGIAFLMTFEEWWGVWKESGHWRQRGKGKGKYVMGRLGDKGPYAIGNVKIITQEQNLAYYDLRPASRRRMSRLGRRHSVETRKKMSKSKIGNQNLLGWVPTEETRRKLSRAIKDRPRDELGRLL